MQYNVRAHDNVRAYASAAKVQVRSNCTSCVFHASGARGTVADILKRKRSAASPPHLAGISEMGVLGGSFRIKMVPNRSAGVLKHCVSRVFGASGC